MEWKGAAETCFGEDITFDKKVRYPHLIGPMKYMSGTCETNGYGH